MRPYSSRYSGKIKADLTSTVKKPNSRFLTLRLIVINFKKFRTFIYIRKIVVSFRDILQFVSTGYTVSTIRLY